MNFPRIISSGALLFCVSFCRAAEFEIAISDGGGFTWRSGDSWYVNKGESSLSYPSKNDDVKIVPQYRTSNFYLSLQLPTGSKEKSIEINSFEALMGSSMDLPSTPGVERFIVRKDFVKTAESESVNGVLRARYDGNLAIGPNKMDSFLHVQIGGDIILKDDAANRTAIMGFGGNDVYGTFKTPRLLASLNVAGNVYLSNHMLFVGTENGVNANIAGLVHFKPPVSGRQATLILNGDNGDEAWQQLQTVKVGGLKSMEQGAGLITTRTASQRFPSEEQLKRLPRDFKSDNVVRHGNLEIVGRGGIFTGEIRDNLRQEDTRGKVNITMNSAEGRQYLLGNNVYSGSTYMLKGYLAINSTEPLRKVFLRGGTLSVRGDTPSILDLDWSGGAFEFDFEKSPALSLIGEIATSFDFEKSECFKFHNIVPRRSYTLFESKNPTEAFKYFEGKTLRVTDYANNKIYDAVFGVGDSSLTVMFISK